MTDSEIPHLFFFFLSVPFLLNCQFKTFPSGNYRKVLTYFTTYIILLCIILNGKYRKILTYFTTCIILLCIFSWGKRNTNVCAPPVASCTSVSSNFLLTLRVEFQQVKIDGRLQSFQRDDKRCSSYHLQSIPQIRTRRIRIFQISILFMNQSAQDLL